MPSTRPAASTTAEAPRALALISRISSEKPASGSTRGTPSPLRITSLRWVSSLRPRAPPGVRAGEVLGVEAARVQQRHRQRVAQRQLRGGAGGGRQVQRAGFLLDAAVEHDVGVPRQRGTRVAGHGHQRHAQALDAPAGWR